MMGRFTIWRRVRARRLAALRRGAVAVEFAAVAPVLVTIVLGMVELTRVFEVQNLLEIAAREGARFASIDRDEAFLAGQSTGQKLENDIRNLLASNGIDRDAVTVEVLDHETGGNFDLDDPANSLRLFDVRVSINYGSVSFLPMPQAPAGDDDYKFFMFERGYELTGTVTFRNGKTNAAE